MAVSYCDGYRMPAREIRFAVCSPDGLRAATWKCWSPPRKCDVYLACRELRGALKTSLHESGNWHVAYLKDFFDNQVGTAQSKQGRFIERWDRPTPIAPGVTLAYRVVTPWSSCNTRGTLPGSVHVVPRPAEGQAIEFDIFLIDSKIPISGWPGKNKQATRLVGSYALPNGASVWVVWWEVKMPDLPQLRGNATFYKGKNARDLELGNLRALAFGAEADGSKVIYDCVVKYEARDP